MKYANYVINILFYRKRVNQYDFQSSTNKQSSKYYLDTSKFFSILNIIILSIYISNILAIISDYLIIQNSLYQFRTSSFNYIFMNPQTTFSKKQRPVVVVGHESPIHRASSTQTDTFVQSVKPKQSLFTQFKGIKKEIQEFQSQYLRHQTSIGTIQCNTSNELESQEKQKLFQHQHYCCCYCQSILLNDQEIKCNCLQKKSLIKKTVSNFIDCQSSGHSQLSFRSEVIQKKEVDQNGKSIKARATFQYQSNLTIHEIRVFEREQIFKPKFIKVVSQWIQNIFAHKNRESISEDMKQNQKIEQFFEQLKNLKINHPFSQNINQIITSKSMQTYASMFDKLLFQYGKFEKFVYSFDFMFSHITYIILNIFYWFQIQQYTEPNPLISKQQQHYIQKQNIKLYQTILLSLKSYICQRSRQMINNPIVQKLILQFHTYINDKFLINKIKNQNYQNIRNISRSLIQDFTFNIQRQLAIKETLNVGKNFNDAHLFQIYQKYQKKDKFIQQNFDQQINLFCQIDKKNFVATPINRYYQTGSQKNTDSLLARNHTFLSCWILRITLKRYKQSISIGIKYCLRIYQLAKSLFTFKNFQRSIFFLSILYNIKLYTKSIWQRFLQKMHEKKQNIQTQLHRMRQSIQKLLFVIPQKNIKQSPKKSLSLGSNSNQNIGVIYQQAWIYRIIEGIKCRFKDKDYLNINFHNDVQQFAKKISFHRKILQIQLLNKEQNLQNTNKTIKLNLNYRFLNYYIYEKLKTQFKSEIQMFQNWKQQAKQFEQNNNNSSMILYCIVKRLMG